MDYKLAVVTGFVVGLLGIGILLTLYNYWCFRRTVKIRNMEDVKSVKRTSFFVINNASILDKSYINENGHNTDQNSPRSLSYFLERLTFKSINNTHAIVHSYAQRDKNSTEIEMVYNQIIYDYSTLPQKKE